MKKIILSTFLNGSNVFKGISNFFLPFSLCIFYCFHILEKTKEKAALECQCRYVCFSMCPCADILWDEYNTVLNELLDMKRDKLPYWQQLDHWV